MKRSIFHPRLRKRRAWKMWRVYGLMVLVVCLTFLSLKAQFRCWTTLFGKETAVIASLVFEIIRLSSLYALFEWTGKRKMFSLALYLAIAFFCGSLGVMGWYSIILETHAKQDGLEKERTATIIGEIKSLYARKIQAEITTFDRAINSIEEKMDRDTSSAYLQKRRGQVLARRNVLVRDMEKFLSERPADPDAWIQKNAAIVEMKYTPEKVGDLRLVTMENAVMKTWHVEDLDRAKRLMAAVLVVSVEATIVLLSLILSRMIKIRSTRDRDVTGNDGIVDCLTEMFDENDIKMFVRKCRDKKYDKMGGLPKSSELTARLRPIRQAILENGFDDKALRELFSHYMDNSKF